MKNYNVSSYIVRWIRLILPPILWEIKNRLFLKSDLPSIEYIPNELDAKLSSGSDEGWNSPRIVAIEKAKWDIYCRNLSDTKPLGFSHESYDLSEVRNPCFHNVHISYGYVLAVTAQNKKAISVLDVGGSLGHYYRLSRIFLPDVKCDFHVMEVPLMVQAGRELNPEVQWHTDESCLRRTYDLVMINGSLQYICNWSEFLRRTALAISSNGYLYLTRVPIVENTSFMAVQRIYGTKMLHRQFNQKELLKVIEETGLLAMREFVVGDRPFIKNAPEQCELKGWLFRRRK